MLGHPQWLCMNGMPWHITLHYIYIEWSFAAIYSISFNHHWYVNKPAPIASQKAVVMVSMAAEADAHVLASVVPKIYISIPRISIFLNPKNRNTIEKEFVLIPRPDRPPPSRGPNNPIPIWYDRSPIHAGWLTYSRLVQFEFQLTFQFSFLRPTPMGIAWRGDKSWPECQCVMLYNRWSRQWVEPVECHQQQQRLLTLTIGHVFPRALPGLCLFEKLWRVGRKRRKKNEIHNWLVWMAMVWYTCYVLYILSCVCK